MRIVFILLFSIILHAFNFSLEYKLYQANSAYKKAHYKKALKLYEQIEPKSDKIYFNIANCYYRLKKYQKAIDYYKLTEGPKYNAKKLYNIGNAYVMQKNYLKAVIFYKNALKFSNKQQIKENLKYAKEQLVIMQDIMLSSAKCATTMAELDNFDDQNISKDLQDAKYLNESKFNIANDLHRAVQDISDSKKEDQESNRSGSFKIDKQLIDQRTSQQLKERKTSVLLIPLKEKK